MDLKNKKVLIFQQRGWAITIGHFLAKKLQAEGCKLAAVTLKKSTHNFVLNQKEVEYKYILSIDDITNNPDDFLSRDISLEEICDDLGIDTIWPLINSNRQLVRSYREKYYYGYGQNVPDEHIVKYFKALCIQLKVIFDNFKPDLVIVAGFIFEGHAILSLFAQKHNIPTIGAIDSKVENYYIFCNDFDCTRGRFFRRVDELNNRIKTSDNIIMAREYIKKFREEFIQPQRLSEFRKQEENKSLLCKVKSELSPLKQILSWYLKGKPKYYRVNYLSNIGSLTDTKTPRIILRDYIMQKKFRRAANKFNYYDFNKINKYVYFPLQFQPEGTIDATAPFFCNQIETARQVAMSLPGDYTLVVKDHPAMFGLRSSSYLKKLYKTPNVKLIDYRISNEEVLKKADLIISPNSTSIAEAAFLRKPAIQLGNLGTTLKLPNVFCHTDMTTLSKKIKEVLRVELMTEEYERRLGNYVAAVYDVGFDFDYKKLWDGREKNSINIFLDIYFKEFKSLYEDKLYNPNL